MKIWAARSTPSSYRRTSPEGCDTMAVMAGLSSLCHRVHIYTRPLALTRRILSQRANGLSCDESYSALLRWCSLGITTLRDNWNCLRRPPCKQVRHLASRISSDLERRAIVAAEVLALGAHYAACGACDLASDPDFSIFVSEPLLMTILVFLSLRLLPCYIDLPRVFPEPSSIH
ncbi:hypothetical protein M405DRAFT_556541 [Rhizopogon salebrosus TDB-379]|nr:hypothetical protein M405DRAFT_556541 [Rhizopogon salebrosus TDB-379]